MQTGRMMFFDDIVADYKGTGNDYELLKKPISRIQGSLSKENDSVRVSVSRMKDLVSKEKSGKKRSTLIRWLKYGVQIGELPDRYYLDEYAKLSVIKSALQKYIRRGMEKEALDVAHTLYLNDSRGLCSRLKTILCEDAYSAIGAFSEVDSNPLGVAQIAARLNSDGHCYKAMEHVNLAEMYTNAKGVDWLSDNFGTAPIEEVLASLSKLRRAHHLDEVAQFFAGKPDVCFDILNTVKEDDRWDGDILLSAALRVARCGFDTIDVPVVDKSILDTVTLESFEWFVYDMHNYPGVTAMKEVMNKFGYSYKAVEYAWWYGSSAIRIGEPAPPKGYEDFVNTEYEVRSLRTWDKIKDSVPSIVEGVITNKFKIKGVPDAKNASAVIPY